MRRIEMKIELNDWEVNLVLKALGGQPYNDVAPLIQNIVEQAKEEENHGN